LCAGLCVLAPVGLAKGPVESAQGSWVSEGVDKFKAKGVRESVPYLVTYTFNANATVSMTEGGSTVDVGQWVQNGSKVYITMNDQQIEEMILALLAENGLVNVTVDYVESYEWVNRVGGGKIRGAMKCVAYVTAPDYGAYGERLTITTKFKGERF
jgi:hypothetical protein